MMFSRFRVIDCEWVKIVEQRAIIFGWREWCEMAGTAGHAFAPGDNVIQDTRVDNPRRNP